LGIFKGISNTSENLASTFKKRGKKISVEH
jgi:hypothetical protein